VLGKSGREVDDPAAIPQTGDGLLSRKERAFHIHIKEPIEYFFGS
jgi:hypothetical protein